MPTTSKLVYGLLFYAALFMLRPWEYEPSLAILPWERFYAIFLIAIIVLAKSTTKGKSPWGPVLSSWVAFLLFLIIASVFSIEPRISWIYTMDMIKITIFSICILLVIRNRSDIRLFLLGWIAIQYLYQVKSLYEHFFNGRGVFRMGTWRLIGIDQTLSDPNAFAATTVFLLPFVLLFLRTERSKIIRLFLASEIALAIIVVLRTGSRGGLLLLITFFLLTLVYSKQKVRTFLILTFCVFLSTSLLPEQLVRRYQTIFDSSLNESANESAEGRKMGFLRGVAIGNQRPLFGVGPGCYPIADRALPHLPGTPGFQSHNLIGELIGAVGYLGTGIWFFFFSCLIISLLKIRHLSRKQKDVFLYYFSRSGIEIVILLFLYGIVAHNLFRYTWIWLGAVVEIALILASQNKSSRAMPSD